ncbi:MAG: acyl-CoA dehydrogenase family protein, partial [Ilumatobacteraceae bacterium]
GSAACCVIWDATQIFIVPRDAWGAIEPARGIDGTLSLGRVTLQVPPVLAVVGEDARRLRTRADLLVAAYLLGLAEEALAKAVEYAGIRRQFGQPIGAFQAIKHRCADMAVRADGAFAQTSYAAVAVGERLAGAATEAAIAKYVADEASRLNSEGAVQIHGAMGFTSEATPHRYVNRGHLLARCLASRAGLLDRIVGRYAEPPATTPA